MRKSEIKIHGCGFRDIIRLAQKNNFVVFQGAKHYKIQTPQGETITMIPRHNPVNPYTAKEIIEAMNNFGANIRII
jgi:hypothetical protein